MPARSWPRQPCRCLPCDTEDDLARRVLRREHAIYPAALAAFVTGLAAELPECRVFLANPQPWRSLRPEVQFFNVLAPLPTSCAQTASRQASLRRRLFWRRRLNLASQAYHSGSLFLSPESGTAFQVDRQFA